MKESKVKVVLVFKAISGEFETMFLLNTEDVYDFLSDDGEYRVSLHKVSAAVWNEGDCDWIDIEDSPALDLGDYV